MTLNNARKRFQVMGCELERSSLVGRYKYRPMSESRWRYGDCLQSLLVSAHAEVAPKKAASMATGDVLLSLLQVA